MVHKDSRCPGGGRRPCDLSPGRQWLVDTGRPLWDVESFQLEALRSAARAAEFVLGFEESRPVAITGL